MRTKIEVMELYDTFYNMVYRLSFILLKNMDDACDATQDIFLKLLQKNIEFSSTEHAKAWLIVATRNHCKNILRSHWKKAISLTSEQSIFEEHHFKEEREGQKTDEVLSAVLELPEELRTLIYLHYFEGFTIEEIAKQLKRNPSTLRSKLAKARKQLKLDLSEEE